MSSNAWSVSTLTMLAALQKEPTINGVLVSDLKYTVLDINVVYRGAEELAELHSINKNILPKMYASFRPERLALHETIVSLSTTVQLSDENTMRSTVERVHERVCRELDMNEIEAIRTSIQATTEERVRDYMVGKDIGSTEDANVIKGICDEVKKCPKETFGKYKTGYTEQKAMVARATDLLFTKAAKEIIAKKVAEVIEHDSSLTRLNAPDAHQRQTYMVAGGQASGKGSSVECLKIWATEDKVQWDDVVKVNTDSYKALLLKPGSVRPEYYSQLAQEEASMITVQINNRINKMSEKGIAPHSFIDQVFVGSDQIKMGLGNGGHVKGVIVSTDVGDAIERSFARGQKDGDMGRYENTQGILKCHQAMTTQVPTTLQGFIGQDVHFLIVDNNVKVGDPPTEVADINLGERTVVVHSEPCLSRFVQKTKINPVATSTVDLYTGLGVDDNTTYLNPLLGAGGCKIIEAPSDTVAPKVDGDDVVPKSI